MADDEAGAEGRAAAAGADATEGVVELTRIVATLLVVVLSTIGCAAKSSALKPIADRKQVTGSWNGWMWNRVSGATQRVTVMIPSEGPYQVTRVGGTMHLGQLTMTGEVLRYSHGSGFWNGRVELVEEGGKQYLRFFQDNPRMLWIECERSP